MTNLSDLSNNLADTVEQTANSIVSVQAARPISGTVIGENLVLTVAHILPTDEVTIVTADGRELSGQVAGRDPASDLALIKIEGLNMPTLNASAGVRIGELLLAIGRPARGLQSTLGFMERQPAQHGPSKGWMHSGAAPFRGVSGGALVDAKGALVGILNAGISRGDLLAVPAERALKIADLLASKGRVPRGYLGIATQPVHFPAATTTETEGQPAKETGGRDERGRHGRHGHGGHGHGGHRGWGERGQGERGQGERGEQQGPRFGFGPNRGEGGPFGWGGRGPSRGGRIGLTIVQVETDSPAAVAGLKVGDTLLALDGETIRHPKVLLERIREFAGSPLSFRVLSGGTEQDITVQIGER